MPAFEQGIVLFPGGTGVDIGPMSEGLDEETIRGLRTYFDSQPTVDEIAQLSEDEAQRVAGDRMWALVSYLRTLNRPRSWVHRLFRGNPELDPGGSGR